MSTLIWRKSSFSSDSANCVEVAWTTSSFCHQDSCVEVGWTSSSLCAGGDCVQVRHDDDVVYVRDSKLGDDSPVQEWPLTYWEFLCDAIVADLPRFSGYRKLDDGGVELRWEHIHPAPLIFDDGEWKAFVLGVRAGEFDPEKLSEGVSAGSGSVAGSGEAATGAVDGSGWSSDGPGSPVPVAAQKPLADAAWSREFLANAPAASADGSGLRPSPATGTGDGLRGGVPVPVAAELGSLDDELDTLIWSEDPSLGEPQGPPVGRPVDVSTDEVDLSSAVQPGSDAAGTGTPPDPVPVAQYGDLIVRQVEPKFIVEQAPDRTLMSLSVIQAADERALFIAGGHTVYVGYDAGGPEIVYQVVGWDAEQRALILERIAPPPAGAVDAALAEAAAPLVSPDGAL
jgi:hypothetical protein